MSLGPDQLLANKYCLHEASKDLDGQVVVLDADYRVCSSPACEPLVLLQFLRLDATSNKLCDSQPGTALDGLIRVRDLTTVFTGRQETCGACTPAGSTGFPPPADASPGRWRGLATRASCARNLPRVRALP
jgi:hypothetical protein